MPRVNEASHITNGTKSGEIVRNFTRIVRAMRALPCADLETLYAEVAEQSGYEHDISRSLKR